MITLKTIMAHPRYFLLGEDEKQILQLLSEGDNSREIGKQMNLSSRTIEAKISVLRLKLRARNACNLVAIALCKGYLQVDKPVYGLKTRSLLKTNDP